MHVRVIVFPLLVEDNRQFVLPWSSEMLELHYISDAARCRERVFTTRGVVLLFCLTRHCPIVERAPLLLARNEADDNYISLEQQTVSR